MWTINSTGCQCPQFPFYHDKCACCVASSYACSCGSFHPSRCAQCGLEAYCGKMCNMTLDSTSLLKTSGIKYGSITAPPVGFRFQKKPVSKEQSTSTYCWYKFQATPNQRIEIQVYRVMGLGNYKNDRVGCTDGFIQIDDGWETAFPTSSSSDDSSGRLCGQNIRFIPPVVIFKEGTRATLKYFTTMEEKSNGTRFLLFFNFPSKDEKVVGIKQRGADFIQHTGRRVDHYCYSLC
ncbi:Uncharacterised protein r2_g409 [Pycnogonum litorale]